MLLISAATLFPALLSAQVINTIAGTSTSGYSGDGSNAIAAECFAPTGIVSASGNIYFADKGNDVIRKINASGIISTIAGTGVTGYTGDNGPATAAKLNSPTSVAIDAAGNIYLTDDGNNVIRKISAAGIITTIAGNGTVGYYGDHGPATNAWLNHATGVAVNDTGGVIIADANNHVIRVIDTSGKIRTIVGVGSPGYSGDGSSANIASLNFPKGVTVDAKRNIYISDNGNAAVRKVDTLGIIRPFAGNGSFGYSGDGDYGYMAKLSAPTEVAVDAAGNVYIADFGNHVIRKMTPSGYISTYAGTGTGGNTGDGGNAASAQLSGPYGVATDVNGNLYVADEISNVIRIIHKPNAVNDVTINNGNQLHIFPNPATSESTIELPGNTASGTFSISDISGRMVQTGTFENTKSIKINSNTIASGTYFISVKAGGRSYHDKLVIE